MEKIINFDINEYVEDSDKILQIEELCKENIQIDTNDIEILLSNLSYLVRKNIADYEDISMKNYSFSFKCDLAQSMICYYLNDLNIKCNPINTNEVINGVCGHSLVLAYYGEKIYLIDPTYIQFFSKEKCDINKYVIIDDKICISPDPGYFVVRDNKENIILPLLENGYIEFNEEVAKAYGDSFFQTKQGVSLEESKNNVAGGSNYIKWFNSYTSNLSKTIDELENMNLLIKPINSEKRIIY